MIYDIYIYHILNWKLNHDMICNYDKSRVLLHRLCYKVYNLVKFHAV